MRLRPERVIADLRELHRLSGGPEGAQRVCWTPVWQEARMFRRGLLDEIGGVRIELPTGGWLDGALGVMAGVEVLRAAAHAGVPRRAVKLVDFADEEGARFGRSLFGSSAGVGDARAGRARGAGRRGRGPDRGRAVGVRRGTGARAAGGRGGPASPRTSSSTSSRGRCSSARAPPWRP